MKIKSIIGAQPQFIKCAPLSHELIMVNDFMSVHMYNQMADLYRSILINIGHRKDVHDSHVVAIFEMK